MQRIVLLKGGNSPESEISLRSSDAIAEAILKLNYTLKILDPAEFNSIEELLKAIKSESPDLVFIGLHGGDGEDGTIQAVLKSANIRFTGSDHKSSAVCMDKYLSWCIAKTLKIPVPTQWRVSSGEWRELATPSTTQPPLQFGGEIQFTDHSPQSTKQSTDHSPQTTKYVVKPNSIGSSVGIRIVDNKVELENAINDAFKYDTVVLVQEFIQGKELTVSILGDKVLPVVEIQPKEGFYDYKNKYTKGTTDYICPAPLTEGETLIVQSYAEKVFRAVGCSVYGRVDFLFDGKDFYFLEVNTLPGMTKLSLVPMAAREVGLDFVQLVEQIIALSL